MQLTRGIGRRHGDGEAGLIGLSIRSEPTTFLPLLIEIGFKFLGVIRLGKRCHGHLNDEVGRNSTII